MFWDHGRTHECREMKSVATKSLCTTSHPSRRILPTLQASVIALYNSSVVNTRVAGGKCNRASDMYMYPGLAPVLRVAEVCKMYCPPQISARLSRKERRSNRGYSRVKRQEKRHTKEQRKGIKTRYRRIKDVEDEDAGRFKRGIRSSTNRPFASLCPNVIQRVVNRMSSLEMVLRNRSAVRFLDSERWSPLPCTTAVQSSQSDAISVKTLPMT